MGDGRTERLSTIGDRGQAEVSLTSWGWNEDTGLLCTLLYNCVQTVKYTEAQPLVEDACMKMYISHVN